MFVTGPDPRAVWRRLADRQTLSAEEEAQLRALPAGAREADLSWVCTTQIERRGHFDKDEQGEVFSDLTHVTGWKDPIDPRVQRARGISFYGVETIALGVLSTFPALGAVTALTVDGCHLAPEHLEAIGRAAAWEDLSIWGARWSPAARRAGVRELSAFPGLLGLELHSAGLNAEELAQLPVGRIEDLTLTGTPIGESPLFDRLGPLIHLDLRDARIGPKAIAALAPKLSRAKRIVLSGNALGDDGLTTLLAAHALDSVEDLWLSSCGLTAASARALAEAAPAKLRGLWLDSNPLTDAGVEALVRSALFAQLTGLSLFHGELTGRSEARLAGHPLAAALRGTTRLPGVNALWFLGR